MKNNGMSPPRTTSSARPGGGGNLSSLLALYSILVTALLFFWAFILSPAIMDQQQKLDQLATRMGTSKGDQISVLRTGQKELQRLQSKTMSKIDNVQADIKKQFEGGSRSNPAVQAQRKLADPGNYSPIDCQQVLDEHLKNHTLNDPNEGVIHARQVKRWTHENPQFWMSLHYEKFDETRWIIMKKGDYYELSLGDAFSEILQNPPNNNKPQRVIDVGGNIGFFSMLSASNGPNVVVDAFEPNPINQLRFCQSLQMNQWDSEFYPKQYTKEDSQVNLYSFGVGQEEAEISFLEAENPGESKFLRPGEKLKKHQKSQMMRVIMLDKFAEDRGWLNGKGETTPDIAIMKVDVEGLDNLVIKGAAGLIQSKIVRNIAMEVSAPNSQAKVVTEETKEALRIIADAGYTLHRVGGWKGPDQPFKPSDSDLPLADAIIEATRKKKEKKLNLWWTVDATIADK